MSQRSTQRPQTVVGSLSCAIRELIGLPVSRSADAADLLVEVHHTVDLFGFDMEASEVGVDQQFKVQSIVQLIDKELCESETSNILVNPTIA